MGIPSTSTSARTQGRFEQFQQYSRERTKQIPTLLH